MDSVSALSSAFSAQLAAQTSERRTAVAANAVRTEQQTVATLIEALQLSASYGSSGQMSTPAAAGTRFAAQA